MWSLLTNFIYHLSVQIQFYVDAVYEYYSNILLFLFLLSGLHIHIIYLMQLKNTAHEVLVD